MGPEGCKYYLKDKGAFQWDADQQRFRRASQEAPAQPSETRLAAAITGNEDAARYFTDRAPLGRLPPAWSGNC